MNSSKSLLRADIVFFEQFSSGQHPRDSSGIPRRTLGVNFKFVNSTDQDDLATICYNFYGAVGSACSHAGFLYRRRPCFLFFSHSGVPDDIAREPVAPPHVVTGHALGAVAAGVCHHRRSRVTVVKIWLALLSTRSARRRGRVGIGGRLPMRDANGRRKEPLLSTASPGTRRHDDRGFAADRTDERPSRHARLAWYSGKVDQ